MIGHWIRHRRIVAWKLKFLIALLVSFGSGGFCGALLNQRYGPACLLLAAAGSFAAGAIFFAVMHRQGTLDAGEDTVPRTSIFPND
jgi:hypothetical protein